MASAKRNVHDRMVGGGSGFLDGLQGFLANYKQSAEQRDESEERLISGVEKLIARARRQPGFDFLQGLQSFIDKERASQRTVHYRSWPGDQQHADHQSQDSSWNRWQAHGKTRGERSLGAHSAPSRWDARRANRRRDSDAKDDWHQVQWRPRQADWESSQTQEVHIICGKVEFSKALDDFKDEAFVVLAKDYDDYEACSALAQGERNPMVTLLFPTGQHWPEEVPKPKPLRVPGTLQRAIQVRTCLATSFVEGSPSLQSVKQVQAPSVKVFRPSPKDATGPARRQGWVVRLICPWAYQNISAEDWKRMTAQPGSAARAWAGQHEATMTQLGDTFGFELRDGHSRYAQLRGLLRVHSADAAIKLIRASGKSCGSGKRWFVEPLYGELPGLEQGVLWHNWEDREDWQAFANRVARLSEHGVVLGRSQLGSRVARGDPRLKDKPSTWRASKVPREWHGDMVVEVFESVGFRQAEVHQRLSRNRTTDWIVRLFQPSLQDATGAVHAIDLIKEVRRRHHSTNSRALPGEMAISFRTESSVRREKRSMPETPQTDAAGDQDMDAKAKEEEEQAKRAKTTAQDAKAPARPQAPKAKGPWLPDGGRIPNAGKGACMMLAVADALKRYAPEEKASGRSVRAFVATWYQRHMEEYAAIWDGLKPGAKDKEASGDWKGSFEDYVAGIKLCGTWCCYLELTALAHALKRDFYVLNSKGEVKGFCHCGQRRPICLYYDEQVGHYEWIEGDVEDELKFWATPHEGKRLVGGGRSTTSHASSSLRLADFASAASSRPRSSRRNVIKPPFAKVRPSETMSRSSVRLRDFAFPERPGTSERQDESLRLRDFASPPATLAGDAASRAGTWAPSSAEVRHLAAQANAVALAATRRRLRVKTKSWISLAAHCGGRDAHSTPCGTAGPPQGPGSCGSRSLFPVVGVSVRS